MRGNSSHCRTYTWCRKWEGNQNESMGDVLAIATFYYPMHMNAKDRARAATESIYKLEKPMRRWSRSVAV